MILTVDLGNSRVKWALWRGGEIVDRGVAAYESDKSVVNLDGLFSPVKKPSCVFAVCVAGGGIQQKLSEWVRRHWQLDVEFLKTQKQYKNIINAYQSPEQYGADRWAAIVAGYQRFPDSPVCVISAGTAITFDLIDKDGQHLGGYILPSYVSMHKALLADTMKVSSVLNMKFHKGTIPDNTDDAVNQGLHKLLQAGIREFCQFLHNEVEEPMQIIVTGGFAETILAYPDMPAMHHEPDLIMQGLYSIMNQHSSELSA